MVFCYTGHNSHLYNASLAGSSYHFSLITARQAVSIQNTEQQTKGDEKETDNKNKGET